MQLNHLIMNLVTGLAGHITAGLLIKGRPQQFSLAADYGRLPSEGF